MEKKRPLIITLLCIYFFLGAVIAIPLFLSVEASQIGAWYQYLGALSTIIGLISTVGLWKMKKWAVVLYVTGFLTGQLIFLVMDIENKNTPFLSLLIVIVIMFSQYSKMD